jgi:hypothetical protein
MSLAITSFSFDQPSYPPGAVVTLTVGYTSTDVAAASSVATAVTVALSDADNSATQVSDGSATYPDLTTVTPGTNAEATTVSATDSRTPSGTWTLVSNNISGSAPSFTGIAVLTGTA